MFKPADKTGHARKFARPFHGPFRVVDMDSNTARIRRVDRPEEETILVALDRLRRCPQEVPQSFWPPDRQRASQRRKSATGQKVGEPTSQNRQPVDPPIRLGSPEGPAEDDTSKESRGTTPDGASAGDISGDGQVDDTVSDVTQPEDSSQRSEDTSQQPEDTSQEPDDTSQQSEETPQHSEDTHRQPPDTLQQSRRPDAMRNRKWEGRLRRVRKRRKLSPADV